MISSTQGKTNDQQPPNNSINTSSGDWIICDSTSRPGHKYYFNKITHKSVWSLNDVEVIKNQLQSMEHCFTGLPFLYFQKTSHKEVHFTCYVLPHHPFPTRIQYAKEHSGIINSILDNIPEPRDPPTMDPSLNTPGMSNQLINLCSLINTGRGNNVWATPPVAQPPQFLLVPAIAPLVNTPPDINQNQMLAYQNAGIQPTTSHLNPGQLLAFQNVSAFNSQASMPNMNYNQMFAFQNSYSHSNQYGLNDMMHNNKRRRSVSRDQTSDTNSSYGPYDVLHNSNNRTRSVPRDLSSNIKYSTDLRQKLTRKRKFSETCGQHKESNYNHRSYSANNSIAGDAQDPQETQSTSIADFLNSDNCYIVVDTEAILKDFMFIDNLIDDSNIRLVVPYHVMKELKDYACQNRDARRIVRFLSEKVESHLVTLGKELDEHNMPSNADKIYITSSQLAEDNNHIILVSNDAEVQRYKSHNEHIQIVTIYQLKEILSKIKFNAPPRFSSPTRAIKIIVPNEIETSTADDESEVDMTRDINTSHNTSHSNLISSKENVDSVSKQSAGVSSKQTEDFGSKRSVDFSSKRSVDFGVQINMDGNNTIVRSASHLSVDEIDSRSSSNIENNISQSNIVKRREIKLNRSAVKKGHQEKPAKNEPKQQFRWSRRRIKTDHIESHTQNGEANTEPNHDDINDKNQQISKEISVNQIGDHQTQINKEGQCEDSPIYTQNKDTSKSDKQSNASKSIISNSIPELPSSYFVSSYSKMNSRFDASPSVVPPDVKKTTTNNTKPKAINESQNKLKSITLRNCNIFEIVSQCMEDVLRTRCDEWISQFVQIMEEILREKLQEDPTFESKDFPPPWNLHEAAKCIIKKFSDYFNVVDAANKLSFVLYKLSDDKGNIKMDMQPSEYMEMYSYGVYLIETLRDVSEAESEDLEVASERLNKLLYDIHNANLDTSHNDIFDVQETPNDRSMVTEVPESLPQSSITSYSSSISKSIIKPKTSPRKIDVTSYKLRSSTKKPEIEVESTIKSPINKSTFLSCLRLTSSPKTPSSIESTIKSTISTNTRSKLSSITRTVRNTPKSPKSPQSTPLQSPKAISSPQKQDVENQNEYDKNINTEEGNTTPVVTHKIIRNFQICPEFEERLNRARNILELDDYTEEDYSDNDYYNYDGPININQILNKQSIKWDSNEVSSKETFNFKRFMLCFLDDLKMQFANVQLLCENLVENRRSSDRFQKERLTTKAKQACTTIEQIKNSLNGILNRDMNSETSFMTLLKKANIEFVSDEICSQYRSAVIQFKFQSDMFSKLLKQLLPTT